MTAIAALKRSEPQQAIGILEQLLDDRGLFPQAMLLLGDAYLAAGNGNKAREIWEATAAIQSGIALHERLGRLYDRQNRIDEQMRQSTLRLHAIGIADLRNSKIQLATEAFQQALQVDDSLFRSWFYLGECYRLSGKSSLAKDAYRRCLELAPNHGRAQNCLDKLR